MAVKKADSPKKSEKLTRLGDLKPDDKHVFRLPGTTYEEAVSGKDGACFYKVLKMTPEKSGRVAYCPLDGTITHEAPDHFQVIVHCIDYMVSRADMV